MLFVRTFRFFVRTFRFFVRAFPSSFPRRREPKLHKRTWAPAFAGATIRIGSTFLTATAFLSAATLVNTIPAAAAEPIGDAARGAKDYATYCAVCHGVGGEGDGPLASRLEPKPSDHTDAEAMARLSDAELFRLLKEGGAAVGRSPLMLPWGKTLSDERIAGLVAYLRTLPRTRTAGETRTGK